MKHNVLHSLTRKKTLILPCILITLLGTVFNTDAKTKTNTNIKIMTPQQTGIKTIVFDLGDVLFTTSRSTQVSLLVPTILWNPTLLYWLTQINTEEAYFKFLETIPATSKQPVYRKGKALPLIMADWMSGTKTPTEIKEIIAVALKKTDHATSVKNLFTAIANLMFVPESLANAQKLVIPMATLLKKFKNAGYQICILSNWDAHTFKLVKKANSKLFNLCDEIIISGQEKLSKPNPEFYRKVFEKCGTTAAQCLFIDDEPYNIKAAQALGFKTIQHIDAATTSKELISTGFMTLCQTV